LQDGLDAFFYHPELRGEIVDPLQSSLRGFTTAELAARAKALGLIENWWHTDEEREATRSRALAGRWDRDLWVFGYGSLMWDPAFRFTEVRRARVPAHERRFILKDIYGARGNEAAPGLMAALDQAGDGGAAGCDGLLYRIDRRLLPTETAVLWQREMIGPAYRPEFVTAFIDDAPQEALAFVADHSAEIIAGDLSRAEQVRYLASGRGFLGSSLDYLRNVARKLNLLGIRDDDVEGLLRDAEAYATTHGC